jgi:hypothetical protein
VTITNEDEILSSAIAHFGENAQIIKSIEEMSELSTELSRYLNRDLDPYAAGLVFVERKVIEELADVMIMCKQLQMIFEGHSPLADSVDRWKAKKLQRLDDMVGDSQ